MARYFESEAIRNHAVLRDGWSRRTKTGNVSREEKFPGPLNIGGAQTTGKETR